MKTKFGFTHKKLSLAISLAATLPAVPLYAMETQTLQTPQGLPIFELRFFDVGDGPFNVDDDKTEQSSTWSLNARQKQQIIQGGTYWATVITPQPGQLPGILNVGTMDEANAAGTSGKAPASGDVYTTQLQAALTNQDTGPLDTGAHGLFVIGKMDFNTAPYVPSQLPTGKSADLPATVLHELGHALGIMNNVADKDGKDSRTPYFGDTLSNWAAHLRDDNGNPAAPGQAVLCKQCKNDYDPNGFDLRKDQGYFSGEHVSEVLGDAMPGLPVRIMSGGSLDDDYMSHIELKNSLMSHQNYRNYTTFMEAELAAMQDLGYQIDRRNFFGYSVYGSDQTIYNQNGYYQRDPSGTSYLVGAESTTPLGLGLHVYGSYNQIHQQADLLTRGDGAAGVRVDGEGNTLVVDPGTRIHANGVNGVGVLFAYGKSHDFIQRGDIEALGQGGIAAGFSFGNNAVGNDLDYRGSYIRLVGGASLLLPELEGALVDNVDISGRLAGNQAALLVDANALVNNINVLNGAKLEGNIYNLYNQKDEAGEQRLTQLTFGRLADSAGRAADQADPNFSFQYNGNISGLNSLALVAQGGETALNGTHQVYSVEVAPGATLSGTSEYTLNEAGDFTNHGTVAPTGTITVKGDYEQGETGQLLVNVNSKGAHDTLVVKGEAQLGGRLTVAPERGWYSPQWKVNSTQLLSSTTTTGSFSTVDSEPFSPTLSLRASAQKNGSYLLSFNRASNAYAQYALSKSGRAVGQALSQSAAQVQATDTDRQKLYTTLDFSAADGSTVAKALDQLSPSAYSAMMASSLQREQQVADAISAREPGKLRNDEWQTFIQPFGGNTRQNSDSHTVGYTTNSSGVIFGAETAATSDGNLIVGLHGAASKQSVNLKDPLNGDGNTTALELGVHARYAEDPMAGSYMLGNARIGYETGELKRKLNFDDYSAENKADWSGKSASVVGGGGYRFKLNDNVSLGPIATLTYTSLWRDGTHEKGADGTTLKLDSQQFDSLRSSLGLNSAMKFPLDSGHAIKAEGQVTWNHELLDTDLIQDATFANYQGTKFKSKNTVIGRDSMGLRGNVRYQLSENVDVGAGVSSDLFRTGYNSVAGNLSLDWRF
ncbi:autotransporter domain-containing protein [Pseudomonas sp. NY15181]|uniref:autotransporter outer membrane beta-barrel domain-containing protein n=1 Tax=Pseudomonas sp. NY15181 TaxID=3400349 RepID=UPI003A85D9FA